MAYTTKIANRSLFKIAATLLIPVLIVVIIKYGKPFLMPITFAALLSMLLLPVFKWFCSKGINKAISNLLSILLLVVVIIAFFTFFTLQVSDLSKDASKIEKRVSKQLNQMQAFISNQLGISYEKQQKIMNQQSSASGTVSRKIAGFVAGLGGLLANFILVLVYIFLFIYYRKHLKKFILRIMPANEKGNAIETLDKIQTVSFKYLIGLGTMIIFLWVMYSIGFSISGVNNPIFFAILAGTLEIVPFVGNLIGNGLTILMALVQGGGMKMVLIILITYAFVQFIQTYILEPLVVGGEVNINPLFTIIALVAGELLWGISGMILAIPLIGITKIVCDNIDPLKPYGELIGGKKQEGDGIKSKIQAFVKKIKGYFKKE